MEMQSNESPQQGRGGAPLPPGPWLVFVRKRGDERRCMGASLTRARAAEVDVGVIYAEREPSLDAKATRFLPELRRETLRGAPDSDQGREQIANWLEAIGPATVFAPSTLWGDDEQRAFAMQVERALAAVGYEGPLWTYDPQGDAPCNRYLDVSAALAAMELSVHHEEDTDFTRMRDRLRIRAAQTPGATAVEGFWVRDRFVAGGALIDLIHATAAPELLHDRSRADGAASVAVIIRTRNRPELLGEAVASLLTNRRAKLEVIVVNDGGVTVSDVLRPFEPHLDISLIEMTEPVGRVAAANRGIRRASSTWLVMLDDDDVYLPGGIDALVDAASDIGSVYFGAVDFVQLEAQGRRLLRRFGAPYDAALMAFENQIPFIGCLMPRAQVLSLGGLDETLECFEDWDLYLRLAQKCPFVFVDRVVAEYRSFESAFASGRGGVSPQLAGLTRIYVKHLRCGEAELLARAQVAVKQKLLPRQVKIEAAEAVRHAREQALADRERLTDQIRALHSNPLLSVQQQLRVAIVIVNFNGRHHLEKCIPAVLATRHVAFEVIVVDNASRDDSVQWLRSNWPQVRVIAEGTNHGFGHGNQIGIQATEAEYVALLNSDTVVTPEWLLHLLVPLLLQPQIGTTCSQLRLLHRPELLNARGGGMSREGFGFDVDVGLPFIEPQTEEDAKPVNVLFPSGAAMLVRKHEFLAMGGFDPLMFMYHEDVDLGWRYWLRGQRVVMCPRSVVFHAFGGTTGVEHGSAWRHIMGNRHNLRTLWKNYDLRRALGATYRLFRGWLRGGHVGFAWAVLRWNLRHAPNTWRERRRIQRERRMSDQELLQRGLISLSVPPQPDLSVASAAARSEPLLTSPFLWPGRSSALGRLGPGWYGPEQVEGLDVRATTGRAFARLKVGAGREGRVLVKLHVPLPLCAGRVVRITCNGTEARVALDSSAFWQLLEVDARSGEDGMLDLTLDTPSWVSHQEFHNGDMRRLGAFVHSIAFEDGEPQPCYQPTSVTVVITTFRRWPVLIRTLEALRAQTWDDYDVVVVDDGSADETWESLQAWQRDRAGAMRLQVYTQTNTGQGIARNHALNHARGELILFIGDDTIPEPDFIEQHVVKHRETGMPCAVVGYTQWDREGMKVTPLLEYVNEGGHQFGYRYMRDGSDVPYTCFYTSNVSLPREILGTQPFDPNFRTYGWEDIDLGLRLSRRGLRLIYNAQARVHHCHPMVLRDFYVRQIKVGAAIGTMYALHPDLVQDPLMPPADRPRLWKRVARLCVPLLLPMVNWLDARQVRLPERLYRFVLSDGFWLGRDRAVREQTTRGS